jgi:predicted glycogen debranching enzyme
MISLGREICIDLDQALDKEWVVGNGIGGFASGTVSGINTRRYHALLVAALEPPVERTVLLNNIDEEVQIEDRTYFLGANEYPEGKIHPGGFVHMEEFRLENNIPTTAFRLGDSLLLKSVWMEHGHNTTYVRYSCVEGDGDTPLCLMLNPMCNYRDYHNMTRGRFEWDFEVEPLQGGCRVVAREGARPFWLTTHEPGEFTHTGVWYWNFVYRREVERGYTERDDLYLPGVIRADLRPGQSLTLVASTEPPEETAPLVRDALERERSRQQRLVRAADIRSKGADGEAADPAAPLDAFTAQLVRAADSFMVMRDLHRDGATQQVPTVLAGYPWFADWGRDTMISLPGVCLPTGRVREANRILRSFAHFAREGLVPNNFPDEAGAPEYNTADATLWMFAAVERLAEGTGSMVTARGMYPMLSDIIAWHVRGTKYGIGMDPEDGLLRGGEDGVQLTWMDARVDGWVVTPRRGKPVEVNALWYNALRVMEKLKLTLGRTVQQGRMEQPDFGALAERARSSFRARFWRSDVGYLYDVVDGPEGDDGSLRPNQIFALSLNKELLTTEQARGVLKVVREKLLTPYGLRTLSPDDPRFIPRYEGDLRQRDAAYHMGTVWAWLLGPYFEAVAVVDGRQAAQAELRGILPYLRRHLRDAGLGSISEIFDAVEPYYPRGCVSQAWSVAEVLRVVSSFGE